MRLVPSNQRSAAIANPWRLFLAYAVAVVGTSILVLGRLALGMEAGDRPLLIIYFIPIIVSAYIGGLGPGLVATTIAAIAAPYFLLPPAVSLFAARPLDTAQWMVLIVTGVLTSLLSEALLRARRRAEENQKMQARIAATAPGVIYAYQRRPDGTGFFPFASPAIESLFGIKPKDWLGDASPLFSRIHPDDAASVRAGFAESARSLTPWRGTFRVRSPIKGEIWIEGNSIPERESDGSTVWFGLMQDVTELKRLDERLRQTQKMEAMGHLTGGVAHDFNNLLGVIMGNLELLDEAVKDRPELHALAASVLEAVDRGAVLTRSLLAFARQQPLHPTSVDVNRLIEDLLPLLRRTLGETIHINCVYEPSPWFCEADAGQLQNALINLAVNSRDAMPQGGELTIETSNVLLDAAYAATHSELVAGEYVMIAVSDTGSGMTQAVAAQAFDPFFTTKGLAGGSGLGLSMVYGFVKQSRGHVTIYSELDHGTTVKVYLPRREADRYATPPEPSAAFLTLGHEKILVVEDDEAMQRLVCRLLQALGYATIETATGAKALDVLARDRDIALVLTDVVLPGGMKGPELIEQAKLLRPEIKYLFMSGYTDNAIVQHGTLDPGGKLLQKPFRRKELGEAIRTVLDADDADTARPASTKDSDTN
jgi:PAS domain S-box-containing protein